MTVDTGIDGIGTKANNSTAGHGWGDYLIDGPSVRASQNAMFGWYPYTPNTVGACELTDFGWFMNTNNSSEDISHGGAYPNRVGAGIIDLSPGRYSSS